MWSRKLAILFMVAFGALCGRAEASLTEIRQSVAWGETSEVLARRFGNRAILLDRPIVYGDSYVDVVLRGERIAGYSFNVYFQMDKDRHGLKRIHLERPRHGATLGVYRAVVAALRSEFGEPQQSCKIPPRAAGGYQAAATRLWKMDAAAVRAVFLDTTLGATEDCLEERNLGRCGLTAQLFVQIMPASAAPDTCR